MIHVANIFNFDNNNIVHFIKQIVPKLIKFIEMHEDEMKKNADEQINLRNSKIQNSFTFFYF